MTSTANRMPLFALVLAVTGIAIAPAAVAQSLDIKGWADGFGQVGHALQLNLGGDDGERSPSQAPAGGSSPSLVLPAQPQAAPTPPAAGAWQPTVEIAPNAPKQAPSGWSAKVSG